MESADETYKSKMIRCVISINDIFFLFFCNCAQWFNNSFDDIALIYTIFLTHTIHISSACHSNFMRSLLFAITITIYIYENIIYYNSLCVHIARRFSLTMSLFHILDCTHLYSLSHTHTSHSIYTWLC